MAESCDRVIALTMDERAQADVVAASEVSRLLLAWSGGDQCALEKLAPIVYNELRRLAHRHMRRERPGHSLQSTALVNEAYIRLVDYQRIDWQGRAHFFSVRHRRCGEFWWSMPGVRIRSAAAACSASLLTMRLKWAADGRAIWWHSMKP